MGTNKHISSLEIGRDRINISDIVKYIENDYIKNNLNDKK